MIIKTLIIVAIIIIILICLLGVEDFFILLADIIESVVESIDDYKND